ncbi:hypothetical protein [Streptomyces kanamyceticus]|uniref:hypothetical protein n=1 Tax=Streptomyces kanamyceticus TaxID=1967 RepID=UPI0037DD00AE
MALTVVAVIVLSALAGFVWGRRLWAEVAPGWPGGGYGFAVTTGLLTPPAVAAVVVPLKRANWRKEKARSLGWAAAALPGVALSFVILLVTFSATRPKRRRRGPECYDPGQACWVQEQYPYIWLVGLAAAVLCTALGGWIAYRYAQRRKHRLTPPESAAPSGPPRPDRPTCT